MFRRHVDFFAIFAITIGLLAVSQLSAFRFPAESIRVENISFQVRACQVSNRIASRIAYLLMR
jgi:hypothetical protein